MSTTIERALELAATGRFRTVSEIKAVLRREGLGNVDSHLMGRSIRDQLKRVISLASIPI